MASLEEAFNGNFNEKDFKDIDFFFTQRTIKEEHEYIDKKNMSRYKKKTDKIQNFLAIIIPKYTLRVDKTSLMDINIWGDTGYFFNGKVITSDGSTPSFILPILDDKKLFINLNYREINIENKENNINRYIKFIDVPKRYQSIISNDKLSPPISIDKLNSEVLIDELNATEIEI
jgi:glutaredoxin-related protein